MFNLLKKDLLTLSKNKSEMIELLLTPFLLISILGFALGNLMNNTSSPIETGKIGIVNQQNYEEDLSRLEEDLENENIPKETMKNLLDSSVSIDPINQLKTFLRSDEIKEIMEVKDFDDIKSAEKALENDEIQGIIEIPKEFSYITWRNVLFEDKATTNFDLKVQDKSQLNAVVLESLLNSFVEEYNLQSSIAMTDKEKVNLDNSNNNGKMINISTEDPVNSFQYYTIGMGVFFAFSTGTIIAARSYREKEQHVFARIMLTNTSPNTYLLSKLLSGTILTFLQLGIIFIFSTLIFGTFGGKDVSFWINMMIITFIYSLLIGSITSLLTSLSLRSNSASNVGFFSSFTAALAFLGGSFTPVETFSESIKTIGNWTPNGAVLTSYLQIMLGFDLIEVMPLLIRVIAMMGIFVIIAIYVFPKRRLN
ncbi:ABC transporter permease [Marinilactibacillus psychrotolerans]|uniref:ABC transporter (ATP-binding protein) -streptolysin S associated ORF n=1 Tax=Marinilactibacillus psychrotolerans TaxID=191770 RepID=A0AAV3WTW1_9LACT|nr:ABC transporter permease [Marinilactibacillus psychrotolerans]GEL67327.1 ABC transporter (ATP-binding protein) - streptolysin S associated ORF [Marinilactibacillus psychrotolerans]GEQ36270.1 ABC transporter (ATP-binding protein) - streptolysin S associated ORF [Marinilactibacillus psychrotolerans]SDC93203.1 ABC-2 type transport system permease protein [Marinilactibacillus psychrotolerans]